MTAKQPALICIEGPDGSGKTTASRALAEWMRAEWRCFPDRRTPIGQLIDEHLKGEWRWAKTDEGRTEDWRHFPGVPPAWQRRDALAFQALQLANRVELLPYILATLSSGRSVVVDRYWGSGYAYGVTDGLDPEYMLRIHRYLTPPTLSILIDVPVEVSVERLKARGAPPERYEASRDFMARIGDRYRELWARHARDPAWVVVDGSGTTVETLAKLRHLVTPEMMAQD